MYAIIHKQYRTAVITHACLRSWWFNRRCTMFFRTQTWGCECSVIRPAVKRQKESINTYNMLIGLLLPRYKAASYTITCTSNN